MIRGKKHMVGAACLAVLTMVAAVATFSPKVKAQGNDSIGVKQLVGETDHVEISWQDMEGYESFNSGSEYEGAYQVNLSKTKGGAVIRSISSKASVARIDNLTAGTSYYIQIVGRKRTGEVCATSDWFEVVTCPKQDGKWEFKQTGETTTSVNISYSYPGANYYQVSILKGTGKDGYSIDPSTTKRTEGTSIAVSGLSKNKDNFVNLKPGRKSESGFVAEPGGDTTENRLVRVKPTTTMKMEYGNVSEPDAKKPYAEAMVKTKGAYADGCRFQFVAVKGNKTIATKHTTKEYCKVYNKIFAKPELFKVRAQKYVLDGSGRKIYGPWSKWGYFSTNFVVKNVKVSCYKVEKDYFPQWIDGVLVPNQFSGYHFYRDGLQVNWKKINGATGYQIYVATKPNGKYKLYTTIKNGKTTSFTYKKIYKKKLKSIKKYDDYSFYVKPVYKEKGTNVKLLNNTFSRSAKRSYGVDHISLYDLKQAGGLKSVIVLHKK